MADAEKLIASNRKANFQYEILEKLEGGLVLVGSEVKSLRQGKASLQDAYASFKGHELFLNNCHIQPYTHANQFNHEPIRPKKILLHESELTKWAGKSQEQGLTIVPIRLYFKHGRAKVELGLAKGKKMHDKRETIKQRESEREMRRSIKERG